MLVQGPQSDTGASRDEIYERIERLRGILNNSLGLIELNAGPGCRDRLGDIRPHQFTRGSVECGRFRHVEDGGKRKVQRPPAPQVHRLLLPSRHRARNCRRGSLLTPHPSLAPPHSRLCPPRAVVRHPLDAPLAERPDTLLFYFNPNRSTKNVGHFLRIDIVAQVPSPSLAWRR